MLSVAIIANKNWEVEPMLAGMCSNELRPPTLPFPESLSSLQDRKFSSDQPRAIFKIVDNADPAKPCLLEVKVWCVQDLMDKTKSSSSSQEKYRVLVPLIEKEKPGLVIAAGTAGYPSETSYAGNIVAGGRFFVHNGHPGNPLSDLQHPEFEKLLPLNINAKVFDVFNTGFKQKATVLFVKTPVSPSVRPAILASPYYCAVGSVNVTDYGEYTWVDNEAMDAMRKVETKLPIGSIETTHGVIRLSSPQPCMFVSAITDREGHFDLEVTPGQNYTASLNAGMVLGHFINDLAEKAKDKTFSFSV